MKPLDSVFQDQFLDRSWLFSVRPVELIEKKVPSHLCPIIHLDEGDFVILTQQTTSVLTKILIEPTHDLSTFRDEIIAAIDFLITGI